MAHSITFYFIEDFVQVENSVKWQISYYSVDAVFISRMGLFCFNL